MIEEFEPGDGDAADAALIGMVGSAFGEDRQGRAAGDVLARGRQLRRRKRAVPALGALGIVAAVSLGVTLTGPSSTANTANTSDAGSGHTLTAQGDVVNVDEAGFSIHTDAKTGEVTVTVRQLFDETELQALLAKAGVPTAIHNVALPAGTPVAAAPACAWTGARTLDSGSVISLPHLDGSESVITISPAKMPAGSVLGLLYSTIGSGQADARMMQTTLLSGEPTGCVAH